MLLLLAAAAAAPVECSRREEREREKGSQPIKADKRVALHCVAFRTSDAIVIILK